MTSIVFHNQSLDLNSIWYESHKALIMNLCIEFDCMERLAELTKKFLGNPLKLKKLKDPSKPTRTRSAFFYFCDEKRPALMEQCRKKHGKIDVGIVSKQLGVLWGKTLGDRQKYDVLAADDKQRYREEMDAWKNK